MSLRQRKEIQELPWEVTKHNRIQLLVSPAVFLLTLFSFSVQSFATGNLSSQQSRSLVKVQSISPTQRVVTITSNEEDVRSLLSGSSSPYIAFPFVADGNVSYNVQRQNPETITFNGTIPAMIDSAKGSNAIARTNFSMPASGILLKQVGIMRGKKVFSLIISPYDLSTASGKATYYKTITLTLNSTQSFPANFDNLAKVQATTLTSSSKLSNLRKVSSQPLSTGSYIRIVVNREGIYHISGYDLDTAGVNISGFTSQNMTLWNHGKQIPIYVHTSSGIQFTSDSYFEFYGTPNLVNYSNNRPDLYLDPFTDNNVYFLTKDSTAPTQRLVTESGALDRVSNATSLAGYSFTQLAHLEQDKKFERLDNVDQDQTYDKRDHWFWTEVSSNQMATVPFYLPYPDTTSIQPLVVTAAFHGITHLDGTNGSPNVPNEHQAELFINQTHVLSTTWDGQNVQISQIGANANIPQSVLHNGSNNFQVYDANPGNIAIATLAFNWAELKYQRLYVADKDYIRFTVPDNASPGYYNFTIQNFHNSSISVYRLNVSRITDVTIQNLTDGQGLTAGYAALFQAYVQSTGDQFIAVSDSGKLRPVQIEQIPNLSLSSYDYSADYIMIVNRRLDDVTKSQDPNNPVTQLASWYNSHGTKTLVVDASEVYDDFSYGIKSPYGIKSFISYAYHNWSSAPKYVLLVGRGSWNTKNGNDATNLIPVMMMQTYSFGAAASDNFYACVDGNDPIPDIAVGRIPATTGNQLKTVVDKTLSYYSNKVFGWQNTALLIAGEENEFHVQTDSIIRSMIPPNFFVKRLYTSIQNPLVDTKYYGTTSDLQSYFNQGLSLVNFMGHGGGAIWADNGILTNDEVAGLSNKGKYPFVTSMTCFAGAFDGQEGQPLSATLLFAQDKGAVGVLASAGLGWLYNDFFMDGEFIPLIFDSTTYNSSIGYDLLPAKAQYYASYYYWPQAVTMLNQYNLLGDPALVIQLPPDNSTVRLNSYTVQPGQNVSGNISNGPAGGSGAIQVTNSDGDVMAQANVSLDNSGSGSFNIQFPGGFSGLGHVKAYTYNSTLQSSSSIDFSTASAFVQIGNLGVTYNGNKFQITVNALASASSSISSVDFSGTIYASSGSVGGQAVASFNVQLSQLPQNQNEYSGSVLVGADTLKPGVVITGNVLARLSDGTTSISLPVSYTVPGAADLSAFSKQGFQNVNSSMKVIADSLIRLEALIYDLNSIPVQNVRVDFYDGTRATGVFLGSSRVSFDTTTQELATIPVNLSAGTHTVYMYLVFDSLTAGYDLNPQNNFAYNNVSVNFAVANSSGVVAIDSSASLSGGSPDEIFMVQRVSPSLYPQPFITTFKSKNTPPQFFEFMPTRGSQSGNYTLSILISNPDSVTVANLAGLHLYSYDPRTRTLNLIGGNYENGKVVGNVNQPGIFTAAYSADHTPPEVTISVGDQFFSSGDYVPPNPRFSFLLHDEDGVNLNKKALDVELDGAPVDTSMIVLPDTVSNPTSVTASVQLQIKTNGSHTLQVSAEDANGNVSKAISVDFSVRSDFSLRVYGAYPDPFVFQTFIAFEVTSANPIDAVEVKIYTVSGRLIKTIRYPSNNPQETVGLLQGGTGSPTAVGYHEAWWDGTDTYGNQVANGVYFYKVSVNSGGKTLEDIGKMARLR
jgi:hypothetical protein